MMLASSSLVSAQNMAYDLPGGARRLLQNVEGYRATIKSGVVTFEDGVATGAMPGALIRGPQRAVPG